jgi:uncharacterized OsmC-like protein
MTKNENPAIAVGLNRRALRKYRAINARGGTIDVGDGSDNTFTPVELLLVALAGCSAMDIDQAISRHQSLKHFQVTASAVKQQNEGGNKLGGIQVRFNLEFDDTVEGAAAQAILPRAVELSHTKLCTVSRTIEAGEKVRMEVS